MSKYLEIVLEGSEKYSLSEAFPDNKIISILAEFTSSKISNNIFTLNPDIYYEEIVADNNDLLIQLKKYLKKDTIVRVWSSHLDVDNYILLFYICNILKNKVDSLVVVYSDEYNNECRSIGYMTSKEIKELSKKRHLLNKEEINKYSKKWQDIINHESDLRIIENNEIKFVSYDYFDQNIINILDKKGPLRKIDLVMDLIEKYYLNDTIFIYLISRLIDSNKIIVLEKGIKELYDIIDINRTSKINNQELIIELINLIDELLEDNTVDELLVSPDFKYDLQKFNDKLNDIFTEGLNNELLEMISKIDNKEIFYLDIIDSYRNNIIRNQIVKYLDNLPLYLDYELIKKNIKNNYRLAKYLKDKEKLIELLDSNEKVLLLLDTNFLTENLILNQMKKSNFITETFLGIHGNDNRIYKYSMFYHNNKEINDLLYEQSKIYFQKDIYTYIKSSELCKNNIDIAKYVIEIEPKLIHYVDEKISCLLN